MLYFLTVSDTHTPIFSLNTTKREKRREEEREEEAKRERKGEKGRVRERV